MNNQSPSILLVEDDHDLGGLLAEYLRVKSYSVEWVKTGEEAIKKLDEKWLLFILDVSLPGISGFEVAEKLAKKDASTPFIFLTAKEQKKDKIYGLTLGADDYITKPFEVEELLLRIHNILKRTDHHQPVAIELEGMRLDSQNLILEVKGETFSLTEKEAQLLILFIKHEGQLLKREFILNEIWGDDDYFIGRSMDVFISRIRKHIAKLPELSLENVRGVGFRLVRK